MRRWSIIVLFSLCILICSCGPSNEEVKQDFLKANPSAEIVSIGPGEGDGDHVYMYIKYRLPGDPKVKEDEWLYQDRGGKKWENIWQRSRDEDNNNWKVRK